jgi:hypothetical protein
MLKHKALVSMISMAAILFASAVPGEALTITGNTGAKYLLTGSPFATTNVHALLKISFETTSPGANLALCAGTATDFAAGLCPKQLNDSGGPGFRFLTVIDAADLDGKQLYIIREVGASVVSFSVTIE